MKTLAGLLISLLVCLLAAGPSWAAITVTHLTSGVGSTDTTNYDTASIAPTANACVIVSVAARKGATTAGANVTPTLTGNSLTYELIITRQSAATEGGNGNSRIYIFRAMGSSPSSGAIDIDFGAETQSHAAWSVTEYTGVDTSGTHCSGAIVQSASTNSAIVGVGSPATVTMSSAPAAAENLTIGWIRVFQNATTTPGSGFTQLSHNTEATDLASYLSEYKLNEQTASGTFTGSPGWIIGAFELKAAEAGSTAPSATGACIVLGVMGC